MSFTVQKLFNLIKFCFSIVDPNAGVTSVLVKCSFIVPLSLKHTSFSSNRLRMSCLMLRSFTHLELRFLQGERHISNFIFLTCNYPISPAPFFRMLAFLQHVFFLCQNHLEIGLWDFIWVLSSIQLIDVFVFMSAACWGFCYTVVI